MRLSFVDFFKRYDLSFIVIASVIFLIGALNLYSGTHADANMAGLYKKQVMLFLFAMTVGVVVSFIRPKALFRYAYLFYALNIVLLLLVLFVGDVGMGARRWLVIGPIRIQPSEIMKISIIIALARWYARKDPFQEVGFKELMIPFFITLFPTVLIIVEPDLGTGLMLILILEQSRFIES